MCACSFSHAAFHHVLSQETGEFPVLDSRTSLLIRPRRSSLLPLTPDSPSVPRLPVSLSNRKSVFSVAESVSLCGWFVCVVFQIPRVSDIMWYLPFSSDLLHVAGSSLGPSVVLGTASFQSLLWLSRSPLCVYHTFIHSSVSGR